MTDLADQVLSTLHRIAPDVEPARVDRSRPLVDQLDLDSMDYQTFLAALSTEHAVAIAAADVARLRSIDDLVEYLRTHASSHPAP